MEPKYISEVIYRALTENNGPKVREWCEKHPEGPFLALTQRKDSVLQKALYSTQVSLVLDLLEDAKERWPQDFHKKLGESVNHQGNTIFHHAVTHDSCLPAARRIYKYAPQLLTYENKVKETPIFLAVRYGQLKMFKFLNSKIINLIEDEEDRLWLYQVSNADKCYTILHVAIHNEHYELALYIAREIRSLICIKNHMNMTGLHILAMYPRAFRKHNWRWLKYFFPSSFRHLSDAVLNEDATDPIGSTSIVTIPCWERIKKEYCRYEAARQLAFKLIEKDTQWIELISTDKLLTTSASNINEADTESTDYARSASAENLNNVDAGDGLAPTSNHGDTNTVRAPAAATAKKSTEPPTPLVLATKYGCLEIALRIIEKHPQTVEQVGPEYGSILHLALKYRRMEIFNAVLRMKMQMRRLLRLRDQEGNSILHMVAHNATKAKLKNSTDDTSTDTSKAKSDFPWDVDELNDETRSPAFELQDDLLLFEHVEEILKTHYHKTINNDYQTADQLFAAKKESLRDAAQEWMKRTAENCSIVAVLVATVAFAAAYTIPGGSKEDGSPILLNQPFFVVFTVSDVLSLASTLTAVVVFLSILTSSFRFQDFKELLPMSLMFGVTCLIFSLTMMMVAFAATIILMIKNRQQWTRIALYAVAFLPVTVLVATYLPFYGPLMGTYNYTMGKVKSMFPRFNLHRVKFNKSSAFKTKKPSTPSDPSIQV